MIVVGNIDTDGTHILICNCNKTKLWIWSLYNKVTEEWKNKGYPLDKRRNDVLYGKD